MSDRPIIFSAPMMRALLAGRKTQTRRLVKPQPEMQPNGRWHVRGFGGGALNVAQQDIGDVQLDYLPYEAGGRLWVREAWRLPDVNDGTSPARFCAGLVAEGMSGPNGLVRFEADGCDAWGDPYLGLPVGRLRASMHLPRMLSRLTLTVTDVRVERLQDISEEDAEAEGAPRTTCANVVSPPDGFPVFRSGFGYVWNSLHGPGAWDANPWVAVIGFTVHRGNIDALPMAEAAPVPSCGARASRSGG